jgi:single-strand DNA-binding protein
MDLNKAMIIGRLTRDPELRNTPNGTPVATFSMATNYVWTDQSGQKQEKAEFHNIVAWRRLAEICAQYMKKGSKIYVEGRIQTREYLDQTQQKKYFTEIVMDNMIMLDRAGGNAGGGMPMPTEMPRMQSQEPAIDQSLSAGSDFSSSEDEIKVENIPF